MIYTDDDLLMLSGIQHIAFCERQWALIHVEQQWEENFRTVEGNHLHERVDDPFESESRKNIIILRSVSLVSYSLGLYGVADVVELYQTDSSNGTKLSGHSGKWLPLPIEYKRGKPKPDERDEVQLCAQAICLEEIYSLNIEKGSLFYGETRHRHDVEFGKVLRDKVYIYIQRMHELYDSGITPPAVYSLQCKSCSLINICLPNTFKVKKSVIDYLREGLEID